VVNGLRHYFVVDALVVGHDWVAKDGVLVSMHIVMGVMVNIVTVAMVISMSIIVTLVMSVSMVISVIISMIVSIVHWICNRGQVQMSSRLVVLRLSQLNEFILRVSVFLLG
jgi:hypothetical protein